MHPLLVALGSNPALLKAAQTSLQELRPALERALRRAPKSSLFAAGAVGSTAALTASFAAGVAVGWFTAPKSGAQLRAATRDGARAWGNWLMGVVKRESADKAELGLDGHPQNGQPEQEAAGDGSVEVESPN